MSILFRHKSLKTQAFSVVEVRQFNSDGTSVFFSILTVLICLLGCGDDASTSMALHECMEDALASAVGTERTVLKGGEDVRLTACSGVPERFKILSSDHRALEVTLSSERPLRVEYERSGLLIFTATAADVSFRVSPTQSGGTLTVIGSNQRYRLHVHEIETGMECPSRMEEAVVLDPSLSGGVDLCANGQFWLRYPDDVSISVETRVTPSTDSPVSVAAYEETESGTQVMIRRLQAGVRDAAIFRRVPASNGSAVLVVEGTSGQSIEIAVDVQAFDESSTTWSGQIEHYERRIEENGPTEPSGLTSGGYRIDVESLSRGHLVTGFTDATGRVSIVHPRVREDEIRVFIVAERHDALTPVIVGPSPIHREPYRVPLYPVDTTRWRTQPDDISNAALHIARVAGKTLKFAEPFIQDRFQNSSEAFIRWRPLQAVECGSCFIASESPYIELSGRRADPDEWDRFVIAHETTHFLTAIFGRDDSPGGPHGQGRIEPTIAWSEGWATFFASVVLEQPIQDDWSAVGLRVTDLTSPLPDALLGTANDELSGDLSEYLVAHLLWGLYAGESSDNAFDADPLGLDILITPVFGDLMTLERDQGVPGMDLSDYLYHLQCTNPGIDLSMQLERVDFPHSIECR